MVFGRVDRFRVLAEEIQIKLPNFYGNRAYTMYIPCRQNKFILRTLTRSIFSRFLLSPVVVNSRRDLSRIVFVPALGFD